MINDIVNILLKFNILLIYCMYSRYHTLHRHHAETIDEMLMK